MDMKSYIAQKLNEMGNAESKTRLREIFEQVFLPMYEYTETKYADLEQRIYNEIPFTGNQCAIYSNVMERAQVDGSHMFLKPMREDDLQEPTHSIGRIQEELARSGQYHISTVFFEADYLQCKQLEETKRFFHGTLSTEQGEVPATFQLSVARKYMDQVSQLYRLFCANHIPWTTVNCSYLLKFFDVHLVELHQEKPLPDKDVTAVQIAYEGYEKYIRPNRIPVWNVEKLHVESDDFAVPAEDKINYEYRFDLSKTGLEHGYLVDYDSSNIVATRREENSLIAVSSQEKGVEWDITRIMQRKDTITDQYCYELLSNMQTDSFAGRMASFYGTSIKTKLELMRILRSFEAGACLEFDSLHITETPLLGETYEMNGFIRDEVREAGGQKTMLLRFRPLRQMDFLIRDAMSFLVSQVQYIYPEYRCVGVLLV